MTVIISVLFTNYCFPLLSANFFKKGAEHAKVFSAFFSSINKKFKLFYLMLMLFKFI